MLKVFISQPMGNRSEEEILAERREAIESIKQKFPNEEVEELKSYFHNKGWKPLEYIGHSILLMAQADIVYFCKGWEKALGCKIENLCAISYGIDVIENYSK